MRQGIIINHDEKFDIQLSKAHVEEGVLAHLLADDALKIEHKGEHVQWRETGNIAIEYECNGHSSGLAVTEAQQWVHELYDFDGQLIVRLIIPVPMLKRMCARARRSERAGDGKRSKIFLLSTNINSWLP